MSSIPYAAVLQGSNAINLKAAEITKLFGMLKGLVELEPSRSWQEPVAFRLPMFELGDEYCYIEFSRFSSVSSGMDFHLVKSNRMGGERIGGMIRQASCLKPEEINGIYPHLQAIQDKCVESYPGIEAKLRYFAQQTE